MANFRGLDRSDGFTSFALPDHLSFFLSETIVFADKAVLRRIRGQFYLMVQGKNPK